MQRTSRRGNDPATTHERLAPPPREDHHDRRPLTAQPCGRVSPCDNERSRSHADPQSPPELVFDSVKNAPGVTRPGERRDTRTRARDDPVAAASPAPPPPC